jgi:hypothetical protein
MAFSQHGEVFYFCGQALNVGKVNNVYFILTRFKNFFDGLYLKIDLF